MCSNSHGGLGYVIHCMNDQRKLLRVRSVQKAGVCFSVRFCVMTIGDAPGLSSLLGVAKVLATSNIRIKEQRGGAEPG